METRGRAPKYVLILQERFADHSLEFTMTTDNFKFQQKKNSEKLNPQLEGTQNPVSQGEKGATRTWAPRL